MVWWLLLCRERPFVLDPFLSVFLVWDYSERGLFRVELPETDGLHHFLYPRPFEK